MQEIWVQSLDWEDPLEDGTATHLKKIKIAQWMFCTESHSEVAWAVVIQLLDFCAPQKRYECGRPRRVQTATSTLWKLMVETQKERTTK